MSSSTFSQQWTSVNDVTTTNSNNNKQSTTFFLQSQLASPPPSPILRPSQSLISLVESSPIPLKPTCQPSPPHLSSSRVANIIHQFESQTNSTMNNPTKISSPIRSVFVKQWEGTRKTGTPPIVIVESSSPPIPFPSKQINNQPQPIIICERITNHNRSTPPPPPPVSPKSPLIKTWSQLKLISQQQIETIESDSDSAIHTMTVMIDDSNHDSTTLSRSSTSPTTDSTCSSSSSSSSSSPPRFTRPTIASIQKQRQFISNTTSFKRANSPSLITTFTRTLSSTSPTTILPLCSINEDLEQQQQQTQSSTLTSCLIDQYCRLSTSEIILSDTTLSKNSVIINTNLPLRYKRDSFIRLYG